jgi:hypothetical protein
MDPYNCSETNVKLLDTCEIFDAEKVIIEPFKISCGAERVSELLTWKPRLEESNKIV